MFFEDQRIVTAYKGLQYSKLKEFPREVNKGKVIDNTGMSKVYQCEIRGEKYVMKKTMVATEDRFKAALSELLIHEKLSLLTEDVPKFYDGFYYNDHIYILMEYIEGVSLVDYINGINFRHNDKEFFITFSTWIFNTIKLLHDNNIYHTDIKVDNIIYSRGKFYLIDFGLSSCDDYDVFISYTLRGTIQYLSPRYILAINKPCLDRDEWKRVLIENDLWSCGVCCYCVYTQTFPWRNDDNSKLKREIVGKGRIIIKSNIIMIDSFISTVLNKNNVPNIDTIISLIKDIN